MKDRVYINHKKIFSSYQGWKNSVVIFKTCLGGGAKKDDIVVHLGQSLPRLSSDQKDCVARAKKYAMEQSIRLVLMKQTLAHQQQVSLNFYLKTININFI